MDHEKMDDAGMAGMPQGGMGAMNHPPAGGGQQIMPGMAHHHGMAMGVHGMLVVGEEPVYLSHLPMFMFSPTETQNAHNFQIIMEVGFTGQGSDPQEKYVQDRRQTGTRLYTFEPGPFNLLDIVPDAPGQAARRTAFEGTIFRNHFETFHPTHPEPPVTIAEKVAVTIKQIVLFRAFARNPPPLPQLQYLLFGKGPELFLAHLITAPPDFDHFLAARITGHTFTDEELGQGVLVSFLGRPNIIGKRLRESETVPGTAQVRGVQTAQPVELQIEVGTDFYFETGDLEAADFGPPPKPQE